MIGTLTRARLAALPRRWFVPQAERVALAAVGAPFWAATIWQAIRVPAHGASVFSLFGLGFIYTAFSVLNVWTATVHAMAQYTRGQMHEAQPRSLVQLFAILSGMLVCNAIVLMIYIVKGASFTRIDGISVAIDVCILLALFARFGLRGAIKHPVARGWIAVAGKTVPQGVTAVLFLMHPAAAHGLAVITLLGIDILASLRLAPTLRAFLRDRKSAHLRGLLIGEGGNTASGVFLTAAWLIAVVR
jgi:hypothetical protein